MSNRDALRKLTKRFPAPPEISGAFDNILYGDNDHEAAIVGAAILDAMLEKLIVKKLVHAPSKLTAMLFEKRGPLSDFHSRILVATAFGFIKPDLAGDLHRVKTIRNVFAHAKTPVSFKTPEIKNEIDKIQVMRIYEAGGRTYANVSRKTWFALAINLLCVYLNSLHKKRGGPSLLG